MKKRMKKITTIVLCGVCMMSLLVGCGDKDSEVAGNSTSIGSDTKALGEESVGGETKEEAKSIDKKDVPEGLNYEYIDKDYGFKLWVSTMNGTFNDAGSSYRFSKNTDNDRADLMIMKYTEDGSYTDAIDCDLTQIKSSKDIFGVMKNKLIREFSDAEMIKEMTYENLETTTINGVEMTKFEGHYVEDWEFDVMDFAFVGYQILGKNRPILVYVVEKEVSTDNSNLDKFNDMLDDVVSTFVDEEGGTKEPGYLE